MIYQAEKEDLQDLTGLALQLWPDHIFEELFLDLQQIMCKPEAAFFLCRQDGIPVGFAQCQLRHDYVEGTQSSPVGYLEGIFVAENYRKQGIARKLLLACEQWATEQGCIEFASDCELTNLESLAFHLRMGFLEVGRIICFTKSLESK